MKKIILISFLITFTITVFSQVKYPYYIFPDSTHTIHSKNDTLWILKDKQLRKTIEVGEKYKLANEKNSLQELQIKKLKKQGQEKDSLIIILTEDRDKYVKDWSECNEDIKNLGRMNKNQKKITRIVTIVGISTTVLAFVGGVFLGLK